MTGHELKFALTESMTAEFEQRAAIGLTQPPQRLWSRYFDTPAGDLTAASATLRVRRTPAGQVQTVTTAGGGIFGPHEWQAAIAGEWPEFEALPPQSDSIGALLRECFPLLVPVFETDFERQVRLVRPQAGVTLEIACDRGEIRAGLRSERIAEVEIVRKEGSSAAFYHYAMQWSDLHQARLLLGTKAVRGLQLAGWQASRPAAIQLQPRPPGGDVPVAEAAQKILSFHLEHFMANLPATLAGNDPDGVQQLHTALRRFRAALRFLALIRPPRPEGGASPGNDLSAVWRDLDQRARGLARFATGVQAAQACEAGLLAGLRRAFPGDAAVQLLSRVLARFRERERIGLREAMASPEPTAFIIRALAAVASMPQDHWPDDDFAAFAAGRLDALTRRAGRRARRAQQDEQWRAVRTAILNLRCALDDCRGLELSASPVDEAVASLSPWQSSLGLADQLSQARRLLAAGLARTGGPVETAARAAALIDGYFACARSHETPATLRAPLLAAIRRLLPRPAGARRGNPGADAVPAAGAGQAAQDRQALRLSS